MKTLIPVLAAILSFEAVAATKQITTVPSSSKIGKYSGGSMVVFFSTSSCDSECLLFSSSATEQDKNLFWSTMLTAGASKSQVFVRYDDSTSSCNIVSFGVPAQS